MQEISSALLAQVVHGVLRTAVAFQFPSPTFSARKELSIPCNVASLCRLHTVINMYLTSKQDGRSEDMSCRIRYTDHEG